MTTAVVSHLDITVDQLEVSAYRIPTDFPESDGTYEWKATTLVLVEAHAGDWHGIGYSYADTATAHLVHDTLAQVIEARHGWDTSAAYIAMVQAIRNLGHPGIAAMAISAVDTALWDLKAWVLDLPMFRLVGAAHDHVPVYGSGGFTSYSIAQLQEQLGGWAAQGIPRVKMKIGRDPEQDLHRVRAARQAIGPDTELYVDANGAYSRKQALAFAEAFAELGVTWFEEPVSSDDLAGLRLMRDRAPAGMDIAAGEYGYDLPYFRRMLEAEAVDVLQADATRCGGATGFLAVGPLCQARSLELSAHCGPSLHAHLCCGILPLRNLEYFHDHVRIEHMLFDGALTPVDGSLWPDPSLPGFGLEFRAADAKQYLVWKV